MEITADQLRRLRESRGWKQRELAAAAGASLVAAQKWLDGSRPCRGSAARAILLTAWLEAGRSGAPTDAELAALLG